MPEQNELYYALYVDGRDKPLGTLSSKTLEVVSQMSAITGNSYRVELVTPGQAEDIMSSITRLSPGIEARFRNMH